MLTITMVPGLSARVSEVRVGDSPNLLVSEIPEFAPVQPPVAANDNSGGGTVWLSPQKDWWRSQRVDADRRRRLPSWPPDPFGERSVFRPVSRQPDTLSFEGPRSPISGTRLKKSVRLMGTHSAEWEWTLTNTSWGFRHWGIWPNFRVCREAIFWIPVDGAFPAWSQSQPLPSAAMRRIGKWIVVDALQIDQSGKISFEHWNGTMVVFIGKIAWMIRSEHLPGRVAKGHTPLELFVNAEVGARKQRCIELEIHGPQRRLFPGTSTGLKQWWLFRELPQAPSRQEQAVIAQEMLKLAMEEPQR